MFSLLIVEHNDTRPITRLEMKFDSLDSRKLASIVQILSAPPRKPRSDKGSKRGTIGEEL